MTFKPYSDIKNISELEDAYKKENKCYGDLEKWKNMYARILYVFNNTSNSIMKRKADAALSEIQQQMTNSEQCTNSVTPNDNVYADITL